MRQLLLSITMIGILAGCAGGTTTVISDTPKISPGDYGVRAPKLRPRIDVPRVEEKPVRTWDISEDRFITTHSLDSSVEALKLPSEEIQKRLNELDKK